MAFIFFRNKDLRLITYYTQKREIRFASSHAFEWYIIAKMGMRP
jgi:hypothetical protein